jgi:hypothetical protein
MLIEKAAGDFPVPCHYCGALIRRRPKNRSHGASRRTFRPKHPADAPLVLPYNPSPGLSRGMLARLLIHGTPQPATASNTSPSSPAESFVSPGFLQHAVSESRRRAQSALSWVGLLAALVALGLWIFKIRIG